MTSAQQPRFVDEPEQICASPAEDSLSEKEEQSSGLDQRRNSRTIGLGLPTPLMSSSLGIGARPLTTRSRSHSDPTHPGLETTETSPAESPLAERSERPWRMSGGQWGEASTSTTSSLSSNRNSVIFDDDPHPHTHSRFSSSSSVSSLNSSTSTRSTRSFLVKRYSATSEIVRSRARTASISVRKTDVRPWLLRTIVPVFNFTVALLVWIGLGLYCIQSMILPKFDLPKWFKRPWYNVFIRGYDAIIEPLGLFWLHLLDTAKKTQVVTVEEYWKEAGPRVRKAMRNVLVVGMVCYAVKKGIPIVRTLI